MEVVGTKKAATLPSKQKGRLKLQNSIKSPVSCQSKQQQTIESYQTKVQSTIKATSLSKGSFIQYDDPIEDICRYIGNYQCEERLAVNCMCFTYVYIHSFKLFLYIICLFYYQSSDSEVLCELYRSQFGLLNSSLSQGDCVSFSSYGS